MIFLIPNRAFQRRLVRQADAKDTGIHPAIEMTHVPGFDGFVLSEMATDMNVICYPTNHDFIALKRLQASAHVTPDSWANVIGQQRLPMSCRKHDVNRNDVQGLWHLGLPLQGK